MGKTALVVGATGLVGSSLLQMLLADEYYNKVKVLSRKQLGDHEKQETIVLSDFGKMQEIADQLRADDIYCCLGTTIGQAKTKEAFKKVDFEYPVTLAEISLKNGAEKFLVVSALGANKDSRIFYNQVKGEMEQAVWVKDFKELHIFRPSLLFGDRKEKRTGEDAAKSLYKFFSFIFKGPLRKYDGIEASQVAKAMLHFAKTPYHGKHIHESIEIRNI